MSNAHTLNMNQPPEAQSSTLTSQLKDIEAVRDLFARAHDYIAQATYPGHMGMKIAEVLNFLAFQHNDFKLRAEKVNKLIANEGKATQSIVDVPAAKAAVEASLSDEHGSAEKA